jgi:hypothetical protein
MSLISDDVAVSEILLMPTGALEMLIYSSSIWTYLILKVLCTNGIRFGSWINPSRSLVVR